MVFEMNNRQQLERFAYDEPWDEFRLEAYCTNGFQFKAANEPKAEQSQDPSQESDEDDEI